MQHTLSIYFYTPFETKSSLLLVVLCVRDYFIYLPIVDRFNFNFIYTTLFTIIIYQQAVADAH